MVKREHESFSFLENSNLRRLRKEIKEKTTKAAKRKRNEKKERNSLVENKEKTHFWRKWMSFLGKHRSNHDRLKTDKKTKSLNHKISEKWNNRKAAATEIIKNQRTIEIPIGDGKKISKIFIKPGKQAMIAESGKPSKMLPNLEKQSSVPGKVLHEIDLVRKSKTVVGEKRSEILDKRLNYGTEMFGNKTEVDQSKESLLKSRLFCRQDSKETIECSVVFEPTLPSSCQKTKSRKSDGINKKLKKNSKSPVNHKIADERKDQIVRTCKTVSEPAWNERRKILQQQQLQENINNILEQFMCLEAQDIIDFTLSQTKLMEYKKEIQLEKYSTVRFKELSREVSPQILVNIKPFKEQVSEDILPLEELSSNLKQFEKKDKSVKELQKPKESKALLERETQVACIRNSLRSLASLPGRSQQEISEVEDASKTFAAEELVSIIAARAPREILPSESFIAKEDNREISFNLSQDTIPKTPTCTVWGVYKSYSSSKNSIRVKTKKRERREAGDIGKVSPSWEDILEDLGSSDHDVIFRRNISQFRRKVNVLPRLVPDLNSGSIALGLNYPRTSKTQLRKIVKTGNIREIKMETARFESLRLENLELLKNRHKPGRIFETIYMPLFKSELFSCTLTARIETGTMEWSQTREIHNLMESNSFMVVEKGMSVSFEENQKVVMLSGVIREKTRTFEMRDQATITAPFTFQEGRFSKICTMTKDFLKPKRTISEIVVMSPTTLTCCHALSEYWIYKFLQKQDVLLPTLNGSDEPGRNGLNVYETSSKMNLEEPKEMEMEKQGAEKKESVPRKKENRLELFEPKHDSSYGVQILNVLSYGYATVTWNEIPSLKASMSTQWNIHTLEESDFSSMSLADISEMTDVGIVTSKKDGVLSRASSESDSCFDGFQIIYNNSKESINDDEDDTTKQVLEKSASGRKLSYIFAMEEFETHTTYQKGGSAHSSCEKTGIMEILEKKGSRTLKFKSNSYPKENIIQTEYSRLDGHRGRRSLILKDTEKEPQSFRKRRLPLDKEMEIRRVESALVETMASSLGKNRSFVQKQSTFGNAETMLLQDELKSALDSEGKNVERKKTFVLESKPSNVKKEIAAAFNSIKELNAFKEDSKGGGKRISLVIMLSKK